MVTDRHALAENVADAAHVVARRATRVLLRETALAEDFAAAVHVHVDQALDAALTAAAGDAAPPTTLRLLRVSLPPDQRDDWWREVCAFFAEASPRERRAAHLSFLLAAPVNLWTGWTSTRRHPRPTQPHDRKSRV